MSEWRIVSISGDRTQRNPAGWSRFKIEWRDGSSIAWLVFHGPRGGRLVNEPISAGEARRLAKGLLQLADAIDATQGKPQ